MKDEIKEILDYFRKYMTIDDCIRLNKVEDYITNLQEQLHQASLDIQELTERDIYCPSSCDKLTNLQEENERLYKELEKADSITQSCIFEGSRSAGKSYRQCLNWLEDYKSRIDKAVELIKNKLSFETYQHLKELYDDIDSIEEIWEDYNFEDLLNILQGSDKE